VAARHTVVYLEEGRFAGWPANHGIWSWGSEILVGFSRGFYKDQGPFHHIDRTKPEEFLLARSRDAGATWTIEQPQPPGALAGTLGMRHGLMPPGVREEQPAELRVPIRFDAPDFALTVRMEDTDGGLSRFSFSYDRGRTWQGPFKLPLFGQKGVMGRTDYIADGTRGCLLFLTASKTNGREGRPFCARTDDGGLSWRFLSFIGPEPAGYAIMPATVRVSATDLVTTIRRRDPPRSWIDAYASHDGGSNWAFLGSPEPDAGEGNPPSLLHLGDGRLCLSYGYRKEPFGIRARLSKDAGKTWGSAVVLRDDGGGRDLGYVRSVVRPDGQILMIYYYHDRSRPERYLAATIWRPDEP
jgi:BNR repeat-like domain